MTMEIAPEDLSRFFADMAPELDERRRRILCGAIARLLGHGGIAEVSRAADISRHTVAAGVAEIRAGVQRPPQRVRRPGAGRKSATDQQPELLRSLERLVAGDPGQSGGPLEWTLLSSYEVAEELRRQGFAVSPSSAAQLMRDLGFFAVGRARPRSDRKRAELQRHFGCLSQAVAAFGADGQPIICARANMSELADDNPAADGGPAGGWVRASADPSVVGFTVDAIQRWWAQVSPGCFPVATEMIICTDTFATDGDTHDAWRHHLARLARATGLSVTVQAIPQGAWRWRSHESQYSYSVTMAPNRGAKVRCQVTIDLITASAQAGPPAPADGPAASSPRLSACGCRYAARPAIPGSPRGSQAIPAPDLSQWLAEGTGGQSGLAPARHLAADRDVASAPGAAQAGGRLVGYPAVPRAQPDVERRKPKLAEVVAHNIARDISTRRLRPGDRLPSETVALTRFNVSRSSLREALRMLELLGVIQIRTGAGGGPVVGQVTSADFASTTTFYYHLIGVTIREILEARRILEPALVRLAVDQTDPAVKGRLRTFMNRLGGDDVAAPAWRSQRERSRIAGFHWALIETGNGVLDLFSHSLQEVWIARQTMEPYPPNAAAHNDRDHWIIAQAILSRDADLAESLMRTHMDHVYAYASAQSSRFLDEVIDWHLPKTHRWA
jgi:DNA-binding FadR family transcriptional regulator